ncbi:hypothetical protein HK100_000342, partial [Physocladia obscura]
ITTTHTVTTTTTSPSNSGLSNVKTKKTITTEYKTKQDSKSAQFAYLTVPGKENTVRIWRKTSKHQHPTLELRSAIVRHGLVHVLSADTNTSVLTNYNDLLYTTNVVVGTQQFAVDLDTGSSDVWIRGASATSTDGSTGQAGQSSFNTSDSSVTNTGQTFSTSYGSGSVSGDIYNGPVSLAGISATINFGVTTQEQGFNSPGDGLWGLAYASINQIQNGNYVSGAGINSLAFYFSNSVDKDEGELTLNGVDSTRFSGTISYVPISSDSYYQFDPTGGSFVVNGETIDFAGSTGAIADTGTTLLLIPNDLADSVNKAIGAGSYSSSTGLYPIDAAIISNGPIVQVNIGGSSVQLGPKEYALSNGDGTYSSGISRIGSLGDGGPGYIFGDVYLRAAYSVYDIENNRLGFAQAVHPTD